MPGARITDNRIIAVEHEGFTCNYNVSNQNLCLLSVILMLMRVVFGRHATAPIYIGDAYVLVMRTAS